MNATDGSLPSTLNGSISAVSRDGAMFQLPLHQPHQQHHHKPSVDLSVSPASSRREFSLSNPRQRPAATPAGVAAAAAPPEELFLVIRPSSPAPAAEEEKTLEVLPMALVPSESVGMPTPGVAKKYQHKSAWFRSLGACKLFLLVLLVGAAVAAVVYLYLGRSAAAASSSGGTIGTGTGGSSSVLSIIVMTQWSNGVQNLTGLEQELSVVLGTPVTAGNVQVSAGLLGSAVKVFLFANDTAGEVSNESAATKELQAWVRGSSKTLQRFRVSTVVCGATVVCGSYSSCSSGGQTSATGVASSTGTGSIGSGAAGKGHKHP